MACQIQEAIDIIRNEGGRLAIRRLESILSTTGDLGSDATALGSAGRGNDATYAKYKQRIQDSLDYWKSQIGEVDPSNQQTVRDAKLDNDTIIVSYQKGPNSRKQPTSSLGSDKESDPRIIAENLRKDALKSVDGMKAIIEELPDVDPGYKKYVLGLLDKIDPEFIPNLYLYINKEAERNGGVLKHTGEIIVNVAPNMDYSDKTATEVYAHELMHAISKFAIDSGSLDTFPIVNQIEELRDEAMELFSYKDFMPEQYTDFDIAKKKAQDVYDYIFTGDKSVHEFIAYGLTNPKVMNKLKAHKSKREESTGNTLFHKLSNLLNKLLDIVFGKTSWSNLNKTMKKQLEQLTFELMQHNNTASIEVQKSKQSSLGKLLNVGNEQLAGGINKVLDWAKGEKEDIPKLRPNAGRAENLIFMAKFLPKLMLREDLRGLRNQVLSALFMKPENTVQNIIRDVEDPTDLERIIEQLGMDSDAIDRVRELTVDVVRSEIRSKFGRKPTKVEEEAITKSAIDVDIGTIYEKYGEKEISKLLKDPEVLMKKINQVKGELRKLDNVHYNWNVNQSTGLGFYLATGKAGYVQNLNAHNIAAGLLSSKRRTADKKVTVKIDELSTLIGMQYTPEASNKLLASMIDETPEAIKYIVDLNEGAKKDAREQIFETDVNIIKGYSKEIFDDSIDVKVRPMSEADTMKAEGYELITLLDKDVKDPNVKEMGVFKSKLYINSSYNRAATRMTDLNRRGTSLSEVMFTNGDFVAKRALATEIKKIKKSSEDIVKQMEEGEYTPDPSQKLSPVLNQDGFVVDYRYMMGKDTKKEVLGQDTQVSEVLGRTIGSIRDKVDTDIQNQAVLDIILQDMKDNYVDGSSTGRNQYEYIKIEYNSPNKTVSEIYKLLPKHMKQAILDSDEKFIAVRRDMLHNYFGFRDKSIVDFFGIHNITPEVIQRWIRFAEKLWQQIVSISKVDIIIRTPAVFIGNVISNFMYSVVMGTSPVKVLKMQVKNMQAVTKYVNTQREIEKLRVSGMAGSNNTKRIATLEAELKRNPVHDLMEAGMYQAIVEDLDKQDYKSSNKLAQKLHEGMETMPEFIREGTNWLFLNEKTSYFKMMTQATQYSDFVARATEYQILTAKGMSKKEAKQRVLDAFVNYGKPASSFEEYLNNMGMFMFTKYMKRIQRAVGASVRNKPLNVLLSILGQEMFFEVDDIQDQNVLTRSWANLDQDLFEHFRRAYTPTSLQFVGIVS